MSNETTKCPMCGTKLKMINGRMTCKDCGYYVRGAEEQGNFSNAGGSSAQGSGAGSTGRPYGSGQNGYTGQTGSSGRSSMNQGASSGRPAEHNPTVGIAVSVIAGVICVVLFAVIILVKSGNFNPFAPDRESEKSLANSSVSEAESTQVSEEDDVPKRGSAISYPTTPQSSFFWSVAEYIWNKPCDSITEEEFASLTAIQLNREERSIAYQLDHGETLTATYETDEGLLLSDLSCFTGLEYISVDASLDQGDLRGLESLTTLYSENNLEELAEIIPYPEYITELGVEDTFLASGLTGLSTFPNLLYLSVDYAGLTDISALEQFPDLLGLSLTGCDRLTDFSPIMSLGNLEELSIQSDQLKSIDFVRNMPALVSLSIESTQVSSVDALEDCPQLEYLYLYLSGSYSMTDFSVIGNLVSLNELALEMSSNYNGVMPSFENLTSLTALHLKGVRDISGIKDAVNVMYLSLEECNGDPASVEAIGSLQQVTELTINDFLYATDSLEPLTHLPNLTYLDLSNTSVFGNIEEIFGIPTLRYLYLNDCQIGLDFANIPSNETLELLSMNDLSVLVDPSYNSGTKVPLSQHYDLFGHFPNLTDLYVKSAGLDSIAFVENLPKLQYLDITDNSVTSLMPLASLSDFQAVWCGQNTILENLPEDSNIMVYTTEF